MENANRLHPRSVRADHLALDDLRRLAWNALSDLGLTDEEIATYFGNDLDVLKTLPVFGHRPAASL